MLKKITVSLLLALTAFSANAASPAVSARFDVGSLHERAGDEPLALTAALRSSVSARLDSGAEPTTCEGWESDLQSMSKKLGQHAAALLAGGAVDPAKLRFECNASKTECWTWTPDNWKIEMTWEAGTGSASGRASRSSGGDGKLIEGITYECDTLGDIKISGGRVVSR